MSTDWMDSALCAQVDGDMFYPSKGGSAQPAKAICRRCDVRLPCLNYALAYESRPGFNGLWAGIYGGLVPRERRALIRRGITHVDAA